MSKLFIGSTGSWLRDFIRTTRSTGDTETFLLLRRAYQVLADPEQRAKYDAAHLIEEDSPLSIFELKDFVHGLKGEVDPPYRHPVAAL